MSQKFILKLIIDIGNTRIKAAIFENNELQQFIVFTTTTELLKSTIFTDHSISHCIIGTVVNNIDAFIDQLNQYVKVLLFTNETSIPIKNKYQSAHTLGSDRLAGAIGGNFLFPNQNLLIIDAGTCIKYNFVNNKNEYIGGAISAGLNMRFKTVHTFTSRLPLLKIDDDFNTLIGTTSDESIRSGAQEGAVAEIDGFINQYQQSYPDIKILITGGDVNFFEKRLKNPIFADSFLILKGLNTILEYNLKKEF